MMPFWKDNKKMAGMLLVIASGQFLTLMMLGEAIAPDYSMHENAISDLGVIDETQVLFNSSLFTIGLLNVPAGYFFFKAHQSRPLFLAFILGGIGAMGAGLISLDNPIGVHGLFALLAFLFMNLEAILTARLVRGPLMLGSIVMGATGLVFLVMMVLVDSGSIDMSGTIGHGGTERMIAYPALVWMVMIGGWLIGDPELRIKGVSPAAEEKA